MAEEYLSIVDILSKIAGPLISAGGKAVFNRITSKSLISKAISSTSNTFDHIEDLSLTLTRWSESNDFWQIFERLFQGERELTDSDLITSFIELTGFYMEDQTQGVAEDIIRHFLENVEDELLNSEEGISFLDKRIEVHHDETLQHHTRVESQLTEVQNSLKQMSTQLQPIDISVSPEVQELVLNKRIDAARHLIDRGQFQSARLQLLDIRDEVKRSATVPEIRFRVATNLGACALALDEWNTAKAEFSDALELLPEDPKALRNAAVAALIDEDWEQALEYSMKAREADSEHKLGIDVHLESLFRLGRLEEFDKLLNQNSWIKDQLACPLVIARIELDRGNFEEAEDQLRRSLERSVNQDDPLAHALLGQIIAYPLRRKLNQDPPLPWKIPNEIRSRIEEAETHLTKAVEILESRQDRGRLRDALVNRAGVRGMLGKLEEGLDDCNRVLFEYPGDMVASRNQGIILFQIGRFSETIAAFENIKDTEEWSDVALMVASSYFDMNEPGKSVEAIEPLWEPDRQDHHELLIGHFLIKAYHKLNDRESIEHVIEVIKQKWPNDPEALLVLGQHKFQDGDFDEAFALMREGLSYAQGNQRDRIALQLAESFYTQRRFAEAAETYEGIVDTAKIDYPFRAYLTSLFNSGYYHEALKLAKAIRGDGPPIPIVSEIEVLVLEIVGDLEHAEEILVGLVQIERQSALHKLRLANVRFRRGNMESAIEVIDSIEYEEIKDDAQTLIDVASIRRLMGLGGVLPLVYRARRIDMNNPDTHLAYIRVFLDSEAEEELSIHPTEVNTGCTVHLRRDGERRIFTILDEDHLDIARGELSPSDPLAQRLNGHEKGEVVHLREGGLEELTYEIIELQSKFVHAFQQTLSEFSTWFPDHLGLQRVAVVGNDISKVLRSVDDRHEFVSRISAEYKQKKLTFGTVAKLAGVSQFAVWGSLTSRPDEQFLVATGTAQEREREASLVNSSTQVVMDLTALLTLESLGFLDRIPEVFEHILVAQAVLDELNEILANEFSGVLPSMMISKEGGQYTRQELTAQDFESGREFVQRIRKFIDSKGTVIPSVGMLEVEHTEFNLFSEILGFSAFATVMGAKDNQALLVSDDLGLRELARGNEQLGRVEGVSTLSILSMLNERGYLEEEVYFQAIRKLVLGNYQFISINAKFLIWLFRQNSYRVTPDVIKIFSTLQGPDCNENTAVGVAAELIRNAWLEFDFAHQKTALLELLLGVLTRGRIESQVLEKLARTLTRRLALVPFLIRPIIEYIRNWQRQNIMIKGITLWSPNQIS